jgi:hypothetical protein
VSSDWNIQPKDYVLYNVKYVNPWHGIYLRRGVDSKTVGDIVQTEIRHTQYVENGDVVYLVTMSMNEIMLPLVARDSDGANVNYNLSLTFDDKGNCTVQNKSDAFVIAGSGKFVPKGEKNSIGGKRPRRNLSQLFGRFQKS